MPSYEYLIVGAGMTGDAAVKGIREIDTSGTIAVVGSEPHRPYKRPPLTKDLWKGKPVESVWLKTPEDGFDFPLGRTISSIDLDNKRATDHPGTEYSCEKVLLATGGTPPTLKRDGNNATEVIY